jgi:hypothetical protein
MNTQGRKVRDSLTTEENERLEKFGSVDFKSAGAVPFGQKTHLTAFSCGLLMIITQEPAQSLAALDAPLTIEVPVPRK